MKFVISPKKFVKKEYHFLYFQRVIQKKVRKGVLMPVFS